jgi:hypothetical protein
MVWIGDNLELLYKEVLVSLCMYLINCGCKKHNKQQQTKKKKRFCTWTWFDHFDAGLSF